MSDGLGFDGDRPSGPAGRTLGGAMDDEPRLEEPPAPGGRVERAVGRGCMVLSMLGAVLVAGLMLVYPLAVGMLSGCGATGGC